MPSKSIFEEYKTRKQTGGGREETVSSVQQEPRVVAARLQAVRLACLFCARSLCWKTLLSLSWQSTAPSPPISSSLSDKLKLLHQV